MIGEVIAALDALASATRRGKAVNVNDHDTKQKAIALGSRYFSEVRPALVTGLGDESVLFEHDRIWQDLIRLGHGSNARTSYINKLSALKRQLGQFNVLLLSLV